MIATLILTVRTMLGGVNPTSTNRSTQTLIIVTTAPEPSQTAASNTPEEVVQNMLPIASVTSVGVAESGFNAHLKTVDTRRLIT
jgi:hypothetical protein